MVNHCIMAHFHKIRSGMKENFKNVVLVNSYMTALSLCSDLYHSWVDFSGLQLTSTIDALSWLWGELLWIWDKILFQAQRCVIFFFKGWCGSSFRVGSVFHKFEEASENQKDRELSSGPHREEVWCWCSARSFDPSWTQLKFILSHTGLYSILACPVLLDSWEFFIIPVLFSHKCWKADCISCQVQFMGVETLLGGVCGVGGNLKNE